MVDQLKRRKQSRRRRAFRVRNAILRKSHEVYHVRVFRSGRHIYADLYDVEEMRVVFGVSSRSKCSNIPVSGGVEIARAVGAEMSRRLLAIGISKVCFDRGAYRYHGRVAALACGLRDGGCVV